SRKIGVHIEIAMRVTRNLLRAKRTRLGLHDLLRMLRRADEIDLVLLAHPAAEEAGIVRLQLRRRGEWLNLMQQVHLNAPRRCDEFVIEEVIEAAAGGIPPDFLH